MKNLLNMSIGGFAAMAGSILLMPFELSIFPGMLFWAGLIFGLLCQWKLAGMSTHKKGKCGIITFFSGKVGKIVDVLLIILAVMLIIALAVDGYGYICYVMVALTLFLFCLHCVINGKCFAEFTEEAKVEIKDNQKGGKRTR